MTEGGDDPPVAAVVTVGNELLVGRTVDSNAAWLGAEMARLGVRVARRYTVGDVREDIGEAVTRGVAEADIVLVTGGLGPTADDVTREAVARALDAPLEEDPHLLQALRERYESLDRGLPGASRALASVPRGAEPLHNPIGVAPGLWIQVSRPAGAVDVPVVLLPGVPAEMQSIVKEEVAPRLRRRFDQRLHPLRHRTLHTTGIPESELAERVEAALPSDRGPVQVAYLPRLTGVDLRLTMPGSVPEREGRAWLDRIEEAIAPVVEAYRFEAGESGDLVEPLSNALEAAGSTVAVAESCTGGLVAKRLTDRPGSSKFFLGGVIAYADHVKVARLGIDPDVLRREGAVSGAVAEGMASGVAAALGAGFGVGVTGIAGPGGGSEAKPVGLVWYAVWSGESVVTRREVFGGDRPAVRERAAQAALALLFEVVRRTA